MTAEIVAEPVVAWRAWLPTIVDDGLRLMSLFNNEYVWPAEPAKARCRGFPLRPEHQAPVEECSCGIYALKTRKAALSMFDYGIKIVGEVELWGRIIEHEKGYRAEYARVRTIELIIINPGPFTVTDLGAPGSGILRSLGDYYGVPISLANEKRPIDVTSRNLRFASNLLIGLSASLFAWTLARIVGVF